MRHFALALLALLVPRQCSALPPPSAVEINRLIRQLGSNSFQERRSAESKLEALGEKAYPALERAAKDSKDAQVRQRAALLVGRIEVVIASKLLAYLRDAALGDRPVEQARVERAFRVVLRSGDREMRAEAFYRVAELCRRNDRLTALLVETTKHEHRDIRLRAIITLGTVRSPTKEAVAALLRTSRESDPQFGESAQNALEDLALRANKDLRERDPRTRAAAATVLGEMSGFLAKAPAKLVEAMLDNDPDVRECARKALKQIDPEAAKRYGVK